MAKKGKKGKKSKKAKVDFETLRVNDLIKLGYDEASEAQAVKEVTRRLIRVQAAYKNYVPEDKFRNSTGDPNDMDHVGLIKAWNSEKLVDEAEDIIRIWLNQDAKINGIFA